EGFIKAQIRKTLGRYFDKINGTQIYKSKNKTNNDKDNSIKREQVFIDIPFFGKPTEILGKRIINLAKSINPQLHIQPVQRPSSSISKYFPTKDPVPKLLRSNIVYKLDCSNCESTYIGKTIRQTYRRLQEHGANFLKEKENKSQSLDVVDNSNNLRRSDRNKGKTVQYFPKIQNESIDFEQNNLTHSAVKQHEINNNHKIDWENCNIIAKDNKHYRFHTDCCGHDDPESGHCVLCTGILPGLFGVGSRTCGCSKFSVAGSRDTGTLTDICDGKDRTGSRVCRTRVAPPGHMYYRGDDYYYGRGKKT
ncbi:unnamed protein product, partial [Rotaria sp. Silwood1]